MPGKTHTHDEAIKALCDCAATVTLLSYQEVIEGYLSLRGYPSDGSSLTAESQAAALQKVVEGLRSAYARWRKIDTEYDRQARYGRDPHELERPLEDARRELDALAIGGSRT